MCIFKRKDFISDNDNDLNQKPDVKRMNKLLRTKAQNGKMSDFHSEKRRCNSCPKRHATRPSLILKAVACETCGQSGTGTRFSRIIPPMLHHHRVYIILASDGVVKQALKQRNSIMNCKDLKGSDGNQI